MRIFLAGASGAIGRRPAPLLLAQGHHFTGMVPPSQTGDRDLAPRPDPPSPVHAGPDPLFLDAPKPFARSARAVHDLESTVTAAGGLVLRYGYFYGPGTSIARQGSMGEDVARRRLPIVGSGQGVWSFIHIDDAAEATLAAIGRGKAGAYNIVDDEPAPVSQWLPALADSLGAPRPMRLP